jgi:hypothetical protein
METKANEPAFSKPAFYHPDGAIDLPNNGLTKREYFAAMALQGVLANKSAHERTIEMITKSSVRLADALIEELNKTKTND